MIVAAACTGDEGDTPGAQWLDVGADETAVCLPTEVGEELVIGDAVLTDLSEKSVTLTDVSLHQAKGLNLVEAVVVPYDPSVDVVGFRYASAAADLPKDWRDTDAVGTRLAPGEAVNLVLIVDPGQDGLGEMSASRLTLSAEGQTREQSTVTSLRATPEGCN